MQRLLGKRYYDELQRVELTEGASCVISPRLDQPLVRESLMKRRYDNQMATAAPTGLCGCVCMEG
jgi:hypothetical protein